MMKIKLTLIIFLTCYICHAQRMAMGWANAFFICNNGTVMGCGYNSQYTVGDGTDSDRFVPVPVLSLTNIVAISSGDRTTNIYSHGMALDKDGYVWAWGANEYSG